MTTESSQRLPPSSCSCGSPRCEEASTFSEPELETVRLENRVRALVAMLERVQWDRCGECPVCRADVTEGHLPDCALSALLEAR